MQRGRVDAYASVGRSSTRLKGVFLVLATIANLVLTAASTQDDPTLGTAYVTLVSGASQSAIGYAIGALALAESINLRDPLRKRIVLVTPDTHPSAVLVLRESRMWDVVEIDPPNWKELQLEFNIANSSHGKEMASRMKSWHVYKIAYF